MEGIPKNPAEKDDYFKNKGPIPQFSSEFGCIQDVVSFSANDTALGKISINTDTMQISLIPYSVGLWPILSSIDSTSYYDLYNKVKV